MIIIQRQRDESQNT